MKKGQTLIEFCFAATVFMLLVYGFVQTIRWSMMDLSGRRYDHEATLTDTSDGRDAAGQLRPDFHRPRSIDALLMTK